MEEAFQAQIFPIFKKFPLFHNFPGHASPGVEEFSQKGEGNSRENGKKTRFFAGLRDLTGARKKNIMPTR